MKKVDIRRAAPVWGGVLAALLMACGWGGLDLTVRFTEAGGLAEGAPVLWGQTAIGRVARVRPREGAYFVALVIQREAAPQVTEHSRFLLVPHPDGSRGRVVEMVVVQGGGKPLPDGALVEGSSGWAAWGDRLRQGLNVAAEALGRQLDALAAGAGELAEEEQIRRIEQELDRLIQEIGRLGREMRVRLRDEILPRIREEIETLRRRLEQAGRGRELEGVDRRLRQVEGELQV